MYIYNTEVHVTYNVNTYDMLRNLAVYIDQFNPNNFGSPFFILNITHLNSFTQLRKHQRKWDSYEGGGGGEETRRGYSDRIHGPTNEHNDRTQYVIDYVILCRATYVEAALWSTWFKPLWTLHIFSNIFHEF